MTVTLKAVGIVSESIPASVAFYRLLGITADDPGDQPHAEAEVGGLRVMWDSVAAMAEIDPTWTRPSGGQPMTLAFQCASPEEVDQTYARVVAAGHGSHREPWDAFWGQRYAVVVDPDGNHVDLYAAT
ncbi:VOC family protein [Microlunatus sp. Gsoil 973]|uniref:VOC family protein n=1 Tax=Microlunatus sp. Gsoil 973 TaxID=2672569 RepID=UPI0012B4D4E3|nr:VOC family protein [Microlunatus sp. Gsoil 973]QGN33420.1 glyoxalase [Microlunatus sp. Gsoil 973]